MTNYTVIINNILAKEPDAVIHLGYAPNDIAFLRNVQDVGAKFKMLFCIYPGLDELLEKNVGARVCSTSSSYVPPQELEYPVNFGMKMADFKKAWDAKYKDGKNRVRLQLGCGLHHRARHREDAVGRDQSRSDGAAQSRVQPVG